MFLFGAYTKSMYMFCIVGTGTLWVSEGSFTKSMSDAYC